MPTTSKTCNGYIFQFCKKIHFFVILNYRSINIDIPTSTYISIAYFQGCTQFRIHPITCTIIIFLRDTNVMPTQSICLSSPLQWFATINRLEPTAVATLNIPARRRLRCQGRRRSRRFVLVLLSYKTVKKI